MLKKQIKKIVYKIIPKTLLEHARFEYSSLFGRMFAKDLMLDRVKKNYINLGCGGVYIDNMINIDFFSNKNKDYGLDLRYPFRIDTECVDGIFSDHTFEHLSHSEIDNALSESLRILKQGGKIRIIVPDMSIFIRKYCEDDDAWFNKWKDTVLKDKSRHYMHQYFSKIFALNFTSNFYFHQSSWDFNMAKLLLEKNGFENVKKYSFMTGTSELLYDKDLEDRKLISLYVEASKGYDI